MSITNKIVRPKIKYAAYMFVFISAFVGNSAHSTNATSSIEILADANSICDKFGQVIGRWSGSFLWPTNQIIINFDSNCVIPVIKEKLRQEMYDHNLLGYKIQTDTEKLYVYDPRVRFLEGNIEISIDFDGWDRDKIFPGVYSKKIYGFGIARQTYYVPTFGWMLGFKRTGSPMSTVSFPSEFDNQVASGAASSFKGSGGVEGTMATLSIDLIETVIKSTNIVDFYEKITGISDAELKVRQILAKTPLNNVLPRNILFAPNYMQLNFLTDVLYKDAKNDFRSVATNASNGKLTDAEADVIFAAIRYPQGPYALGLLAGRGIGHENNQAPKALSLSDLQVNFNKSRDFTSASDPEDDPLSYSLVTAPSHGTLYSLINGEFKLRYVPFKNFSGSDRFEYQVKDPYGLSDTGVVNLVVNPNQPPIALSSGVKVNWNEEVTFVPNRATDPEGDKLRYSVSTNPSNGTVESVLDGSKLQYIPNKDYSGPDRFEYKVEDPYGLFATGPVDVVVTRIGVTLSVVNIGVGKGIISSNPDGIDCGPYCTVDFGNFSDVTLTAIPDAGYVFSGWGNSSSCSSAGTGSCTLTMNTSRFVNARFDIAPTSFTLTVDKTGTGSGIVTSNAAGIDCGDDCTEDYPAGANTQVTLTPAPEAGSTFRGWTGDCSGTSACTVIMSQNRAVGVTFEAAVPTVFTVSNLADIGAGSLRQAITDANANPGNDSIFFQSGLGGTIILTNGQLEVTDSVVIRGPGAKVLAISGNNVSRVLAIEPGTLGTVDISGLTFKQGNDTSGEGGGGMIIINGTVAISDCTLAENSADVGGGGGGIRKYGPGWLNVTNTTISGNSALDEFDQGEGGGIRTEQDTLTISNSTVSGNSAANAGGISFDDGRLTISNSTVTGNSALIGGGGIFTAGGDLFLENSIIAGNIAPADKEIQNIGTTHSLGHNLFGENGLSGVTAGVTLADNDLILAGAITTVIGPLADNGGQTPTHLPVAGGPAIDVGNNLLIPLGLNNDQRGIDFPRIMNGTVDIGAVERIVKHTLSVSQTGGNGSITSSSGSIDCNANCTADLIGDTEVTLTATPAIGFRFVGWSGACSGTGICTVSMSSDMNVAAIFVALPVVTVTASDNTASEVGLTTGTFTFTRTRSKATALTIAFSVSGTAISGKDYVDLESSVTIPAGASTVTKTVTPLQDNLLEKDETILLNLTQSPDYTLGLPDSTTVILKNGNALVVDKSGEGMVTSSPAGINCGANCNHYYTNNSSVTLTATPDPGYFFNGWGGACSGSATNCTLAMDAAKNVTASFIRLHRSSWKRALVH